MFSFFPVMKLSTPRTLCPCRSNSFAMVEPMKPATPVTRYLAIVLTEAIIHERLAISQSGYASRNSAAVSLIAYRSLAVHDLVALDALGCVACVNHQTRLAHDGSVVVVRVVGHNQHAVVVAQVLERRVLHLQVVMTPAANGGEIRIVVADFSAALLQLFNDGERRRLPQVIDIFLVSHAQHQDFRAVQSLLVTVQTTGYRVHHVIRHADVHFTGKLNKLRVEVILLGLPRKIKRIDRNAVPAQPGSR